MATYMLYSDVFIKPPPKPVTLTGLEMSSTSKGRSLNSKSKVIHNLLLHLILDNL